MTQTQALLAAVAVQLVTAGIILFVAARTDPEPTPSARRRRAAARATAREAVAVTTVAPRAPDAVLGPDRGSAPPVLDPVPAVPRRIDEPVPSADPQRLIQTEVLLPAGTPARVRALLRLAIAVLGFGAALALAVIGSVRALAWLLRRISGS